MQWGHEIGNLFRCPRQLILPDGTRLLGVHLAPGCDNGIDVTPETSDADLVCVGHSHQVVDRPVGSVRVVNVGSASNSVGPDRRASCAVLEANADGYDLDLRRITQ